MTMTWTSLTAAKGTAGSIANWVAYTKIDLSTIVDEAQALAYETLRVREMMTEYVFRVPTGNAVVALPGNFLDPIGRIYSPTLNDEFEHTEESKVKRRRTYSTTTGSLGNNPFTTSSGSALVSVALTAHGFNQRSIFTASGATAVNGLTPNGTFPIATITDANNFVIDVSVLGVTASGSGSGGGAAATYICDALQQIYFKEWAIWDEMLQFDGAASQDTSCQLLYYRSLPLLSASIPSNFLTSRYPNVMRQACITAAHDFMGNTEAYQRTLSALTGLIQRISVENDGFRRGSEIRTETP